MPAPHLQAFGLCNAEREAWVDGAGATRPNGRLELEAAPVSFTLSPAVSPNCYEAEI